MIYPVSFMRNNNSSNNYRYGNQEFRPIDKGLSNISIKPITYKDESNKKTKTFICLGFGLLTLITGLLTRPKLF